MKYYLSSFRTGNRVAKLVEMSKLTNKRVAFISNAMDYMSDLETRSIVEAHDKKDLEELGLHVESIDLRDYFNKQSELRKKMRHYDIIWCTGGNNFILLEAIRRSGLEKVIYERNSSENRFIYGGFSAGASILGPTLEGIHLTDEPNIKPYGETESIRWDGLGILNYVIVPHYQSELFKDLDTNSAIEFLIKNKTLFKAIKDGEVIIIE